MTEPALTDFEREISAVALPKVTDLSHKPDLKPIIGTGPVPATGQAATISMVKSDPAKLDKLATASAEAAMAQYDAAAKAVESMGKDVTDRITKLQAALDECTRDLKLIADSASAVRDKGKAVRQAIEEANSLSKGIRDACDDFRKKVAPV